MNNLAELCETGGASLVLGRFECFERLSPHSANPVYLALDRAYQQELNSLAVSVVLKKYSEIVPDSPQAADKFKTRVRRQLHFSAPGLVSIYDSYIEGSSLFISMEVVHGLDLATLQQKGAVDSRLLANTLFAVAQALSTLETYALGTPRLQLSDILVGPQGSVKIGSVWLSAQLDESYTEPGTLSWASVASELLTGKKASGGGHRRAWLPRIISRIASRHDAIRPKIIEILERVLEEKRPDAISSTYELVRELQPLVQDQPLQFDDSLLEQLRTEQFVYEIPFLPFLLAFAAYCTGFVILLSTTFAK